VTKNVFYLREFSSTFTYPGIFRIFGLESSDLCLFNGISDILAILHQLNIGSWIKIDKLDVTCFVISLFTAQRVSNVSTFIFRSLRLNADLSHGLYCSGSMCVGVTVWFGWVAWYPYVGFNLHKDVCISMNFSRLQPA